MKEYTVVRFRQPGGFWEDPLTDNLRAGSQYVLAQAIEAEMEAQIGAHVYLHISDGGARAVRHGHPMERAVQTGISYVKVHTRRVGLRAKRHRWSHSLHRVDPAAIFCGAPSR